MPGTKYTTLNYGVKPPVAYLTLNRPHASNRVNPTLATELRLACQRLREEDGVRVAILTAKGPMFSSGRERPPGRPRRRSYDLAGWMNQHRVASALGALEMPVIAAINGDAIDHGLDLALACDIRIASEGARLGYTDLFRGVLPWDGGTQRLPRLVGRAAALEMLLTSRLLEAEEALSLGLVSVVCQGDSLMNTAEIMAAEIASGAPIAARYAKEAVLKGMDATLEQGLRLESDLSIILQSTSDRAEGLSSFLEKRPPKFLGK